MAQGQSGETNFASGLRLTPRDPARIGQLILSDGKWNDRSLVPAEWLRASFTPAAMVFPGEDYGYLWRVGDIGTTVGNGTRRHPYMLAWGNGGQCLAVFPDSRLVVAIVSGNYNVRDARRGPDALLREVFLSNLAS
jgi:CubicO group peptidase (beta-lactamase class C family)